MTKIDAIQNICENRYLTEEGKLKYIKLIMMNKKSPESVLREIWLMLRCLVLN